MANVTIDTVNGSTKNVDANKTSGTAARPEDRRYSRDDFSRETHNAMNDTKQSLRQSGEDLKKTWNEGKERMRDDIRMVGNDLKKTAYTAGERMRGYFMERKHDVEDMADSYASTVRAKPIQSSLLALGAGFLLAAFLRRR